MVKSRVARWFGQNSYLLAIVYIQLVIVQLIVCPEEKAIEL